VVASLTGLSAAVPYYAAARFLKKSARAPALPGAAHFIDNDSYIRWTAWKFSKAHPEAASNIHGFNRDQRGSFDETARDPAKARTIEFFASTWPEAHHAGRQLRFSRGFSASAGLDGRRCCR
jgi:dienelactone hydrolase